MQDTAVPEVLDLVERIDPAQQIDLVARAARALDPAAKLHSRPQARLETDEIEAALKAGASEEAAAELGDLLFAVVNLARHLAADPDAALRATNGKFERRFAAIEAALAAQGRTPSEATLAEMDALWNAAKAAEK